MRARADEMLSFGRITLPHNLARVVLLEQIYRACKDQPWRSRITNRSAIRNNGVGQ